MRAAFRRLVIACAFAACVSGSGVARADDDPGASEEGPAREPAEPAEPALAVDVPVPNPPSPSTAYGGDRIATLTWDPSWSRFGVVDWIVTGGSVGAALAAAILPPQSKHVTGGVLFDEGARDALRLPDLRARYTVRDASDVGLSLTTTWPFFVDALITTWYKRGSADVARELVLVDAEAMAITAAIQGVTNTVVSRERPFGRLCGSALPGDIHDCQTTVRHRSFFSGHAALSFTAAGLVCTHHMKLGLLGAPYDAITCAGGLALASVTATFRVMSDMHYASDILTGAIVGSLVGFGVPLLHYGFGRRASSAHVQLVPFGQGAALAGTF